MPAAAAGTFRAGALGGIASAEPMEVAGPQPGPGPAAEPQPGAEEIDMSLGRSGGVRVPVRAAGSGRGRSEGPDPARDSVRLFGRSRPGADPGRGSVRLAGPGGLFCACVCRGAVGRGRQTSVVWLRSIPAPGVSAPGCGGTGQGRKR